MTNEYRQLAKRKIGNDIDIVLIKVKRIKRPSGQKSARPLYSFIFTLLSLNHGMVFTESLHALLEHGVEFVAHTAGASAYAGLERTCGVEVDAGDAVSYEFLSEFAARESGV